MSSSGAAGQAFALHNVVLLYLLQTVSHAVSILE